VRLRKEKHMSTWKMFKRTLVQATPLPGVYRRKEGGHVVRGRVVDPTTARTTEIWKVLPDADEPTAFKWLADEKACIRAGNVEAKQPKPRFADFAMSLRDEKIAKGDLRSAKSRERWRHTLEHLIGGTEGEESGLYVEGFGDFFVDKIGASHVEAWKVQLAKLIAAEDYAPTTVNGWLSVLRVILKAAKYRFRLPELVTEGVSNFDVSEHETYTEEEPNALVPFEVGPYLARFRELYPQFFAMTYLGFITGLRPSSLRPLRRRGGEPDVLWDRNRILVRRSHTLGDEVMRTTKQKHKYAVDLPVEAMSVLRWHVETQLTTPEQEASDLLFPSVKGGFRSPSVLNGPMAEVAEDLGLGKQISQRALRRTFNDLARVAKVDDIVTRSISGHLTEKMQDHYSTVGNEEQREGIARVIDLFSGVKTGVKDSSPHPGNKKAG
jgi:integrase